MNRWFMLALAAIPLVFSSLRPAAPSFTWWTTHALEKVRPYDSIPHQLQQSVELFAARNEFESFQIVLRAENQTVRNVDVTPSDLTGPGGVRIAAEDVVVYFERYLHLEKPSSTEGRSGEWPDVLIPRFDRYYGEKRSAFPFDLTDGRNQAIWCEIYVPSRAPPGEYRGQVAITVDGTPRVTAPVRLTVWNMTLPSTSSLTNTFGFNGISAVRQHKGKYTNDTEVYAFSKLYAKAALRHRITIRGGSMAPPLVHRRDGRIEVDWTLHDAEVGPFLDGVVFSDKEPLPGARATSVELRNSNRLKTDAERIQYYREYARHFREKGWFERLFNYVWDEPKDQDAPEVRRRAQLIHTAEPQVRNLVTASLRPDWVGAIDIWTPVINCLHARPGAADFCDAIVDREQYKQERAAGRELWWYQSCASHGCFIVGGDYFRGWPSYMIDHTAVRNRIMPWLAWKYDIEGELYFNLNEAYSRDGDPWNDVYLFGGNGDGTLFYAGRPDRIGGATHIPIESIRLKLIREGLEDYEYLAMLRERKQSDRATYYVDSLVQEAYRYNQDPVMFYELRQRMGEELSR